MALRACLTLFATGLVFFSPLKLEFSSIFLQTEQSFKKQFTQKTEIGNREKALEAWSSGIVSAAYGS
jgi:hypothetical protein